MSSLQAKLAAFKAKLEGGGPPYNVPHFVVEAMHRSIAELKASGQVERAVKVGDKAPAFTLKDSEGNVVSSSELIAKGPLIVSFYRGVWCPYCNIELQALQAALPQYEKLGASIVAISPQTQPNSRRAARENGLTFPILSDTKGEVSAAFGLRFKMPEYLAQHYRTAKIDLPAFNDDPGWTLPIPSRYLMGKDGTVVYAEIDPDYTRRPEPEDLLPALRDAAG